MNSKVFSIILTVLALLSSSILAGAVNGQSAINYYYTSTTHTVNDETGYAISTSMGSTSASIATTFSGAGTVDIGFRAWLVHSDSQPAESLIGDSPTALITCDSNSTGLNYSTASIPTKSLVLNLNALKVTVYMRFDGGDWLAKASFITDTLISKELTGSTVTFYLYTNTTITTNTTVTFYWGNSAYQSGLGGLTLKEVLPQEHALALGFGGDFIGMIIYPFTYIIGELFYGLLLLGVAGNLYFKQQKVTALLVMLLLFGGASGIGLLIPVVAYRTVYILALLIFAAILYKTFR